MIFQAGDIIEKRYKPFKLIRRFLIVERYDEIFYKCYDLNTNDIVDNMRIYKSLLWDVVKVS